MFEEINKIIDGVCANPSLLIAQFINDDVNRAFDSEELHVIASSIIKSLNRETASKIDKELMSKFRQKYVKLTNNIVTQTQYLVEVSKENLKVLDSLTDERRYEDMSKEELIALLKKK